MLVSRVEFGVDLAGQYSVEPVPPSRQQHRGCITDARAQQQQRQEERLSDADASDSDSDANAATDESCSPNCRLPEFPSPREWDDYCRVHMGIDAAAEVDSSPAWDNADFFATIICFVVAVLIVCDDPFYWGCQRCQVTGPHGLWCV